jgi:hypothetical protein
MESLMRVLATELILPELPFAGLARLDATQDTTAKGQVNPF